MSEKDRKAEIERRKKRLEELRQTRKEGRNKEPVYTKGLESSSLTHRENVDEFVNQILATSPIPSSVSPTPAINPSDSIVINDNTIKNSGIMENSVISSTPVKKSSKLTIDQLLPVNIKPKIIEVYEKHTQTIVDENEKTEIYQEEDDDNLQPNTLSHKKTEYDDKKSEVNVAVREELSYIAPHGTLSEDNKKMILQSEDFSMFIERSSIVMERALAETSDILFDLALSREVGGDKDVLSTINIVRKKQFSDERWTKGRMISSIAWSPHHTGIVLASYYQLDKTTSDPDGVVLMWDLKFVKDTPDYVFNCHSSVMSVTFSKFHPHFVIGGTYSGQIVLWDIRSGKRTPVQRSLLSTSAHTHPIYCLEVVGSLNAHNLISVSTDGRLCCWNLDNLSQPQDYADLQNRNPRAVVVTSLSFPKNEVNKFVVGSEEGVVYQCQRHGKKPGDVVVQYDGHFGAVTAVSCHQATNNHNDFSHLFLSSSFDWTVKLWSLKLLNEQQITSKSATPICSFETNNDYVLDVKWSPVHPALFVTVNGEGRIDFWNINHDSEVPILTEVVDVALAKVQWSPNGQLLAAGDVEGSLYIYEAGEALAVPSNEDWIQLQQTLYELQQTASGEIV